LLINELVDQVHLGVVLVLSDFVPLELLLKLNLGPGQVVIGGLGSFLLHGLLLLLRLLLLSSSAILASSMHSSEDLLVELF